MRKWWRTHFLWAEFAVGVFATAALIAWSEAFGGRDVVDDFLHDHGETFYVVLAPITAAMLGFILAAAAIIVTAAPAKRMDVLRSSAHYNDLWACFRSAMRYLGLATISAILGLVVSGETTGRLIFFLTVGLTVLAAARVARCIWAMNWVIKIIAPVLTQTDNDDEDEEFASL
jgi:hypothetical protein